MDAEPPEREPYQRLVGLVMQRLRVTGPTELARVLKLSGERPNVVRVITNWLTGINAPSFDDLMTMLSAAGLLQHEAEAAFRGISEEQAAVDVSTRRAKFEAEQAGEAIRRVAEGPAQRRRASGP